MVSQWSEARLNWSIHGRQRPESLCEDTKILIVEDTSGTAWFIYELLIEAGYDVVGPAATSAMAAELVAGRRVDVALLDIGLADGPSFSFAESLTARGIPFAFLTGYGADDIPVHLRDRPIVSKPMNVDSVLSVVRNLCRLTGTYRARSAPA